MTKGDYFQCFFVLIFRSCDFHASDFVDILFLIFFLNLHFLWNGEALD